MKINLFYFFILFLLTTKIIAQTAVDTVFVYDTIIVHEIKTVYDTVKVYETVKGKEQSDNFFSKNNPLQNAVLAIDTVTSKAQLILFNKKDTATISINSIIVSENLNNSDTMKKKILTLAAAALLAKSNFAQENKITSISGDTSKAMETSAYSLETIVFQNKKHPNKTYEVTLPATSYISPGLSHSIITHIDDSLITIKYHHYLVNGVPGKVPNFGIFTRGKELRKEKKIYRSELKKIRKDETLSKKEKESRYFELTYNDSVQVPLHLNQSIRFSRFNAKKKVFYNTSLIKGFNEQGKINFFRFTINTILVTPLIMFPFAINNAPILAINLVKKTPSALLYTGGIIYSGVLACNEGFINLISTKKINLERWELKTK